MKLIKARVQNFRSIEDSEEFEVGDMTCLVGKNEAGKTALLHALRGLHPTDNFTYDRTRDYPRRYLAKFDERHPDGKSKVVTTWWTLDDKDIEAVEKVLGPKVLSKKDVEISRSIGTNTITWDVSADHKQVLQHYLGKHKLDAAERSVILKSETTQDAVAVLTALPTPTEKQQALLADLNTMRSGDATLAALDILYQKRMPKFFYTSHFERMNGEISLNKLAIDKQQGTVSVGDQIFLDFIEYAGTTIEDLQATTKYEELVAQCEAASNDITDEIFDFWSQNEALAVKIEIGQGRTEDPPPFNSGTVAKIRIENRNHRVSVPLSERSAGFVWFFSFLSQFKQLKKTAGNAIILLDEPGLTLHGKAQADLLRYIEERLLPDHQIIFSTHSPFMVPAARLSDVRVVEDVVERHDHKVIVKGTKVSSDVLSVDQDTLFPLQAHLGYEITQSLFIGKNTLLVEGPSDVLYLQTISQALVARGRTGMDKRWTVCPTGGLDKVFSFASLFRGNNLNIAVLCDYGDGDKSKVERLKQGQILQSGRVYTAADFTGKKESDIEDLIAPELYCAIINNAYSLDAKNSLSEKSVQAAAKGVVRQVKQVEAAFRLLPPGIPEFDHFTPAEWLLRNPSILDGDDPHVKATLDSFEKVFQAINPLIPA